MPNRYEDLLSPRWKGLTAIDQEDAEWLAGLIETMGREKALDFARKLSANEVNVRRGHTLLGQLVAGGESAIFPDQYLHSGLELKKKGAPVDMYFIEPVLTQTSKAVSITQNTARPYAAMFFIDFLFSKEIQQCTPASDGSRAGAMSTFCTASRRRRSTIFRTTGQEENIRSLVLCSVRFLTADIPPVTREILSVVYISIRSGR